MTNETDIVETIGVGMSDTSFPGMLLFAWAIGVLVAIITLPIGIMRLRKGLSVAKIIALSRVTVFGTALVSLCSIVDLFSTLIPIRAPILTEMTVIGLRQLLGIISTSLFICGVNGLIAFALNQKWKDSPPPPPN